MTRARPLVYAAVALLLGLLGLEGVREAASFRRAAEERVLRYTAERLDNFVDQWESWIFDRVRLLLSEMDQGAPLRDREVYLRAYVRWFDAFYLWDDREITFPAQSVEEDIPALRADPCVARAGALAGELDHVGAAMQYARCIGRGSAVTLFAASEAAQLLLNAGQPLLVDRLMRDRSVGALVSLSLQEAPTYGVSPRRLVFLRLQHAQAMEQLGRPDVAERWLHGLADEMVWLDGEVLEDVLGLYEDPVGHDLRKYGGPQLGGEDDEGLLRAQRRLALYQEVRDREWSIADVPAAQQGPRLLVDQYGDPPYLLAFAQLEGDQLGGVQLDQAELVASLLERAPRDLRAHLSVRDPAGRVLRGSNGKLAVETAFTSVLPHLRVGLDAGALPRESTGTLAAQLLPVGIGILVGLVALFGLIHTDRQQAQLVARQREFLTRVTHELKTPLAGIRLMAENLEMGAFRDAAQRETFARRIVTEAERLGARLDEVIQAASRPLVEKPGPVDAVALCQELFDRWRPLFEQQGASLAVDLPSAPVPTSAQRERLRDALSNLLDNALKYRNAERPLRCTLRLRAERRWLQFEVEDNGLGVPPPMRKAVFERFRRVEGPGRGRAGGHGLGLAFVAEAARLHGGKVECREGVDGGARFVLRIRRRS